MTTHLNTLSRQPPLPRADDIELFARVVAAGSFAQAGRELGLTRAAISRRVAEMERQVGQPLLARTTRSLGLTEAGRRLAQRARALAEAADAARRGLRGAVRHGLAGRLRVTTTPIVGQTVLAPLLARFRLRHPQLQLELLQTHRALDLLRDDVDVAFRLSQRPPVDLMCTPVMRYGVQAYAVPGLVLRHPGELASQACLALAWVGQLGEAEVELAWRREADDARASVRLQPAVRADDLATLLVMSCHGGGVVLAPDFAARSLCEAGLLAPALPGWQLVLELGDTVQALTLSPALAPEAAQALVRFVVAELDPAAAAAMPRRGR